MLFKKNLHKGVVATLLAIMLITAAPSANAQSPSLAELQAQIAQLLATINQLQAGQGTLTTVAGVCPYTWSRSLAMGATGADVMKLQQFLNADAQTQVAAPGAVGSVGMETQYYGPATGAAVAQFQTRYRNEILTPLNLVDATQYFGPSSRAHANTLCISNPTTPTGPTTPSTPTQEEGDDGYKLQGSGDLRSFEIQDASRTDVKEGSAESEIAELTLESHNGDIEVTRMDIALVAETGNSERDPWDTFESISLWMDGEKISEQDIDDRRNDYLNRNAGTVRFSGLDLVLKENEEVEMFLAVSVKNNIDGASSNAAWNVSVERIRYFDADGVASDDGTTGELGDTASFDIVERGDGEELKFSQSTSNPQSNHIVVDDGRRTSNVTIMEYTIEALDTDIELDTLYVNVQTGIAPLSDVIHDIRLIIGKESFRKDTIVTTGAYSATNTRVSFDIDGDISIDEGDEVEISVVVDLKPQTNYANGETIVARVTSAERDVTKAEGSDDIDDFSGTAIGNQHTMIADGIIVPVDDVSFTTTTQGSNSTTGIFTIEFEVTAVEDDFTITEFASTSISSTTGGVGFTVDTNTGTPTNISAVLSSTARENSVGVFTIREGRTETFTLTVVVDAAAAGNHRVALEQIYFSNSTDGITRGSTYLTEPTNKFRTGYQFINN